MPRKRSQKQKNEDLVIVERNLKAIENKPRSSARTSRRLLPVSDIHENDETSETKSTESEKADSSKNVDESTRADKDSFKKPTAPAPRTTRATTKRNDSRASSATTSDLGASHDEFTYDIEPVTEIEPPNIHVDDEEPGTSNQSEQKSPSPKRKSNTKSRSRATKTKESKKSKPETNEPEIENDATSEDTVCKLIKTIVFNLKNIQSMNFHFSKQRIEKIYTQKSGARRNIFTGVIYGSKPKIECKTECKTESKEITYCTRYNNSRG